MMLFNRSFLREKAQGTVEYAILVAFVIAVVVVLFGNPGVRGEISKTFSSTVSTLHG